MHDTLNIEKTEEKLKRDYKKVGEHLYVHPSIEIETRDIPLNIEDTQVVLLVGGMGTRLFHITKGKISKHMLLVGGQPLSKYVYDLWRKAGFKNFLFLIDNTEQNKGIMDFYGDGEQFGAKHIYSIEKKKMGSGGALKLALDSKLLTNTYFNHQPDDIIVNYPNFALDFFKICKAAEKKGYEIVILCAPGTIYPFGEVIDKNGKVTDFIEKPFVWKDSHTGINFVTKNVFPFLQKLDVSKGEIKIERTVFKTVAQKGKMLKVLIPSEFWIAVNDENSLKKFESIVTK